MVVQIIFSSLRVLLMLSVISCAHAGPIVLESIQGNDLGRLNGQSALPQVGVRCERGPVLSDGSEGLSKKWLLVLPIGLLPFFIGSSSSSRVDQPAAPSNGKTADVPEIKTLLLLASGFLLVASRLQKSRSLDHHAQCSCQASSPELPSEVRVE